MYMCADSASDSLASLSLGEDVGLDTIGLSPPKSAARKSSSMSMLINNTKRQDYLFEVATESIHNAIIKKTSEKGKVSTRVD